MSGSKRVGNIQHSNLGTCESNFNFIVRCFVAWRGYVLHCETTAPSPCRERRTRKKRYLEQKKIGKYVLPQKVSGATLQLLLLLLLLLINN